MNNWWRSGAILTLTMTLAACGSDPGFNEAVDFAPKEGNVQFVNMIPQSPQVTVIHGREQTSAPFPVAQPVELRFQDRYDWRIAYIDSDNQEVTVDQADNQQISEAVLSVFFIMGSLDQPNIQIVDIPLIAAADQPDGTAQVLFASNLTAFDMIDVYITDADINLADVAASLTMTSGTVTDVIETQSGTKRIRLVAAGTDTVLFDSGSIEITEKSRELFGLVDDFGPSSAAHVDVIRSRSVSGSIMEDTSQPSLLRVGNYSDFGNITTSLGDISFETVSENTNTAYQTAVAGTQTYTVSNSESSAVLETRDIDPRPGFRQSIYSFNDLTLTGTQIRSLIVRDDTRPIADRSLFKFINGSNQNVDVYVLDPANEQTIENTGPLLNDLTPVGTGTTESLSRTINFVITNSDGSDTLADATFDFLEGVSYTLILDTESELHLLTD